MDRSSFRKLNRDLIACCSWCGRWARHHDDESEARAIDKTGACNVTPVNNVDRNRRFMQDLFNTLVDCRWRYTLLAFVLGYVVSWLVFALIWFVKQT